ncbi:hypothetical protein ACFQ0D_27320, partial [Micromonospora zhanjiangensis]
GPPPTPVPAGDWRPPVHIRPAPPRQLPPQDVLAVEAEEQRARTVTGTVAVVAGVVLLVLFCLLCGRVVL